MIECTVPLHNGMWDLTPDYLANLITLQSLDNLLLEFICDGLLSVQYKCCYNCSSIFTTIPSKFAFSVAASHILFLNCCLPLEKEMATHSSVLAWSIPGMGEPGGLPSMGLHRVGHDWSDLEAAAAAYYLYFYTLFLLSDFVVEFNFMLSPFTRM